MLEALLRWAGGSSTHYWLIAIVAGGLLLAVALRPGGTRPWVFLVALAFCLLAFRWPGIAKNIELGVDESQMIAGALTLESNPVFWKYVDGTTHGPLNQYPITVLGWLGLPIDYTTTRLFALAMVWVALAGVYLLLRGSFDEQLARIAVLPPTAFFALTVFQDFVHYTSEHVPIALLGIGSAWLWQAIQSGSRLNAFLGTAALGAVPWAKLQGAPVALWFALFGGALLAWRSWSEHRPLLPLMSCWFAGGIFATAGFSLMLAIWGLWAQWETSYLELASHHMGSGMTPTESLARLPELARAIPGVFPLLVPLVLVIFTLFGAVAFRPARHGLLLLYLSGFVATSLYVFAAPGRHFFHYILFLVIPFSTLAASLVAMLLEQTAKDTARLPWWFRKAVLAGFVLLTVLPQIHARTRTHPYLPYQHGSTRLDQPKVAQLILDHAGPGDAMTVWGYVPRIHVQTRLKQATRIAHTEYQLRAWPMQPFFRDRFLRDFRQRAPRVFVDAVGPGHFAFTDRSTHGFETWPELAAIIAGQFEFVGEADGCRVFIRTGPAPEPW